MKASALRLEELLETQPGGGVIRLAGQRALLIDAAALGLLRRELIETLGQAGARGILTRLGYAHGWRTAQALEGAFAWESPEEWRRAGARLHALQGLVIPEGVPGQGSPGRPLAEALWRDSYEAEQHLLQLGRADEPVCWTLTGYAAGWLSYCRGEEIYFVETRCVGRGDPACHVVGQTRAGWGEEIEPHLPFFERDCLTTALRQVTEALKRTEQRLRRSRRRLAASEADAQDPSGLVARSDAMRLALDLARRTARVETTVLVTGESGVGKERVARLIHDESPRASGPFLALDCGAFAEGLLESELFGHVKGAFTGAGQDRVGLFEAARGGTLFLDEVGELPPQVQVKLLRVLQEREVRRLGENRARPVDVRLVAATHRDLAALVQEGRFRQDLYYRLRVVELRLPSLRERKDDVLPLAHALLAELAGRLGLPPRGLSPAAADLLCRYPWPGNVRELRNALERALVVGQGERLEPEDLPEEVRLGRSGPQGAAPSGAFRRRPLADVEREHILATLAANEGNRGKTAADLGIGVATLFRRLRSYRAD